jgi:hypothetical protein
VPEPAAVTDKQMLSHADECLLRQSMHLTLSSETEEIARIEADSYPADEKATPEGVVMRQKEAGEFFWTLGPVQVSFACHQHSILLRSLFMDQSSYKVWCGV